MDGAIEGPVGIAGLGVMGGSLARALSAWGVPVRGFSPDPDEARAARDAGAVAEIAPTVEASAAGVRWWVVATPLSALPAVFSAGARSAPPRVIDLASLQAPALAAARGAGLGPVHRSAHPMVGSERSGFGASQAALYAGAPVWLSRAPVAEGGGALDREVEAFWRAVGAEPAWIDAAEHDRRMAAASHLPQVGANLIAALMEEAGLSPADLGPGGLDTTRLAGSAPEMWLDLLPHSAPALVPLLERLAEASAELARDLENHDHDRVATLLARTRRWRTE